MEHLHVTCPVCQAKMKYRGQRTHIRCLVCKERFAIKSEHKTTTQPENPFAAASVPEGADSHGDGSSGLVVGLALGVAVATVIIVAAFLLWGETLPEQARVDQPPADAESAQAGQIIAASSDNKNGSVSLSRKSSVASHKSSEVRVSTNNTRVDTAPSLRYRWKRGQSYSYDFTMVASPPSGDHSLEGSCTYRVARAMTPSVDKEPRGSGTGFFVSSDGYLVTCAHVVQDSVQVTVTLDEQQWTGKVVAFDPLQDLALVKVPAENLPAIALSGAEDVELAEPIRVVGYPLSDMLGKGVKITSGSVSGKTETDETGAHRFQVDATVNPGNSGGPLVDERGRVVGVASALFSGFRVSEVGVAVPAKEVRKLLELAQVRPTGEAAPNPVRGPELARLVTPAVAFLDVRVAAPAFQDYRVEFRGDVHRSRFKPKSSRRNRSAILAGQRRGEMSGPLFGWIAVNRSGEISEYEGVAHFPFSMDPLGKMMIEVLDGQGRSNWSTTRWTSFTVKEEEYVEQFPSQFPRPFSRHHPLNRTEVETKSYPAIEEISYEITNETAEQATIIKTYKFRTVEDHDPPLMDQEGTGTILFDKQRGVPLSMGYQVTIKERKNGNVVTVPYSLSYTLQGSGAKIPQNHKNPLEIFAFEMGRGIAEDAKKKVHWGARSKQDKRQRGAENNNDPERLEELISLLTIAMNEEAESPVDKELLAKLSPEVASRVQDFGVRSAHRELKELAGFDLVPDKREQVNEIFMHYARTGSVFDIQPAVRGLMKWGTEKEVPGLIELLTSENEDLRWPIRTDIMNVLQKYPSEEVYSAVASRLAYWTEEDEASEVLIKFGSPAEEAVCKMLDSKSEEARDAAAEILEEIGTSNSLPALEKARKEEPEHFTKRSMEKAIKAIRDRQ